MRTERSKEGFNVTTSENRLDARLGRSRINAGEVGSPVTGKNQKVFGKSRFIKEWKLPPGSFTIQEQQLFINHVNICKDD
jgi:hypothetical protein